MFQYWRPRAVFRQDGPSSTPVFEAALPTREANTALCLHGHSQTLHQDFGALRGSSPGPQPSKEGKKPFWIQHGSCSLGPAVTETPTHQLNRSGVSLPPSDIPTLALIPYGKTALISY